MNSALKEKELQGSLPLLDLLYEESAVLCPRTTTTSFGATTTPMEMADRRGTGFLPIAGKQPLLIHTRYNNILTRELLKDLNLSGSPKLITYSSNESFIKTISYLTRANRKLIVTEALDPLELADESYLIPRQTLLELSNKANYSNYFCPNTLPVTTLTTRREILTQDNLYLPNGYIKVADPIPSSAGCGVDKLTYTNSARDFALYHDTVKTFILQEQIIAKQNLCIQFMLFRDKSVRYLGFSNQETSKNGDYLRGWVDRGESLPKHTLQLATDAAHKVANTGYYGILGFDVLLDREDKPYFIDLNARVNASTPPTLLSEVLYTNHGAIVVELRSFFLKTHSKTLIKKLTALRKANQFAAYAVGLPDREMNETQVIGFVLAKNRNELTTASENIFRFLES